MTRDRLDRRVNLMALAWTANAFAFSITFPFLPLYLHLERGFPMALAGLVFPIMGLGRVLGPMVSGTLADRCGRRQVLIWGTVGRGLAFVWLAVLVHLEASFAAMASLLFVASFLGEFFTTASDAYIADITTTRQRSEAFSRMRVGLNTGWMLGPAIGAFLARTPFSLLFAITALLCLITAWVVERWCPETDRRHDDATSPPPQPRNAAAIRPLPTMGFARHLLRDRALLLFLTGAFLFFVTQSQLVTTLSVYAIEVAQISRNQLGILYTVNGLLVIALQIPVSRLLRRRGLTEQMALGAVLSATGYLAFGFCPTYALMFVAVAVLTLGELSTFPLFSQVGVILAPAGMVGRSMGAFRLVYGLGMGLGPWLGALLFEHWRHEPMRLWGGLAIWATIASACFLALPRRRLQEAAS